MTHLLKFEKIQSPGRYHFDLTFCVSFPSRAKAVEKDNPSRVG
jgi:hypothetical protein